MPTLAQQSAKTADIVRRWQAVVSRVVAKNPSWIAIERGSQCYVTDADDKRYLDFAAGIASLPLGHCHIDVVEAITRQARRFTHVSSHIAYYDVYVRAAEKLLKACPPGLQDGKLLFSNSGTEAVETALKAARWKTGKSMVLAFTGAFHGRTQGALSVTASKRIHRRKMGALLTGSVHTPYPYCYRCSYNLQYPDCDLYCVKQIQGSTFRYLYSPDDFAAIIVEPIQGEGGYVVPPDRFLQEVAKVTREYGLLLICDEIQSGMGRTGKMFAFEHSHVLPDIVTLGKGIASGMPLGATIGTDEGMDAWEPGSHGSTFGGNPVCCAAAEATIDRIQVDHLIENASRQGAHLMKRVQELMQKHSLIGDVRGKGLMVGLELVKDRKTKEPAAKECDAVLLEALKQGLFILKCGESTIRLCPPLNIGDNEVDRALEVMDSSFTVVSQNRA